MKTERYHTDLIRRPRNNEKLIAVNFTTNDIIRTMLDNDMAAAADTVEFAKTLARQTLMGTCEAIWRFLKTQIPYKVDDEGYQGIQYPSVLYHSSPREGDCKSFSLFAGTILRNLGIPYGYRFTNYDGGSRPKHVYVFVPLPDGGEYIIDATWKGPFNTQKPYKFVQNHMMPGMAQSVAGIGRAKFRFSIKKAALPITMFFRKRNRQRAPINEGGANV